MTDPARAFFRHALATLAYRGGKTVRGAPAAVAAFKASPSTRTPVEILAHVGDLLDWMSGLVDGRQEWRTATPLPWDDEVARFHAALERLDRRIADPAPLAAPLERLLQGPLADALTHVGQIAMLRRMAGSPVRSENYFKADVAAGRVGAEQTPPAYEFD